jgi:hypothetical protein
MVGISWNSGLRNRWQPPDVGACPPDEPSFRLQKGANVMPGWIKATYDNIDETVWLNLAHAYEMESIQGAQGSYTAIRFMNEQTVSVR